jgi:hypothetical protein
MGAEHAMFVPSCAARAGGRGRAMSRAKGGTLPKVQVGRPAGATAAKTAVRPRVADRYGWPIDEGMRDASTTSRARLIALGALGLVLAIFAVSYIRARASDRGAYDDPPAAEIGARTDR